MTRRASAPERGMRADLGGAPAGSGFRPEKVPARRCSSRARNLARARGRQLAARRLQPEAVGEEGRLSALPDPDPAAIGEHEAPEVLAIADKADEILVQEDVGSGGRRILGLPRLGETPELIRVAVDLAEPAAQVMLQIGRAH